jgi:hypothetical protein
MLKLTIAAALLASTVAQAGYYERIPNNGANGYIPTPEEREQVYRQQQYEMSRQLQLQDMRQEQMQREINRLKAWSD